MLASMCGTSASLAFIKVHFPPSFVNKYRGEPVLKCVYHNKTKVPSIPLRMFIIRDGISLHLTLYLQKLCLLCGVYDSWFWYSCPRTRSNYGGISLLLAILGISWGLGKDDLRRSNQMLYIVFACG